MQDVHDAQAWDQFYQYYRTFVLNFARNRGCSAQMAQDVLQESLITLTKVMPNFRYDRVKGRYRTYLLTIVSSRIVDAFRRERKYQEFRNSDDEPAERLDTLADKWVSEWEHDWEKQWQQHLLIQALERVKTRVKPYIFESFRLYVLEQRPASEVTTTMDIPENTIYQHRRRVIAMLQEEIEAIKLEIGES
jgi:RNA polymerase sigma factor (sigma-70 family)